MKTSIIRCFALVALLLATLNAEAREYRFKIEPMGKTESLLETDSLAFLACPVFNGGKIECYPENVRAMVASFKNDKAVEDAMHDIEAYFAEHPLEGEYSIMAGDPKAGKLIGCSINLRHHSAKHDAAVNEAQSWGKSLLFALLTVLFGYLTLILFSTKKAVVLSRIGGIVTAALALIFCILAIIAIVALAFKYICIVLGCALVLVFALSVFGSFGKGRKRDSQERVDQHGWTVNGTVYQSKDAAEEAARNTGSDIHFK